MAIGKPILMMQNGEAARLISDARCGLVCQSDGIVETVQIISQFFELNKEEKDAMAANSRSFYLSNFSSHVGIKMIENIIKEVLN